MTVYTIFGIVAAIALVLSLLRFFIKKPDSLFISYLQDFVGVFFIFSGFVKAVDPLGTSFKMHEYFEAFSQEGFRPMWEYIAGFSTFMAIVMIALELFVGLMLIIGWKPRFNVGLIWLLTLFFTLLTGYTYLSGYCISKSFMVSAFTIIAIFAVCAFPERKGGRVNFGAFGLFMLVLLLISVKFSHSLFGCGFTEAKMKVTDCGCFGDFIKLKPWETFYKDVILDFIIFILLVNTYRIQPVFGNKARNGIAAVAALASLFFCLYNVYWNEPVIDFRPYKIGNDIADLRKEKAPPKLEMQWKYHNKTTDKWETITYDQVMHGKIKYELYDTNYREDKVLDPGMPARILGLNIYNSNDEDITDSLLSNPNYSMMVVSYSLDKTDEAAFKNLNTIAAGCDKAGVKFFAVTTDNGHVDDFRHKNGTAYPFYHADETPLKTMIRSNPGLVLLKNGVLINKWHYKHLPAFDELNNTYFSKK